MKRFFSTIVTIALAGTVSAQSAAATSPSKMGRVADDGLVIDRVAEASKRDLPTDLLKRIANEDIDLLRGKRPDGSYDYAKYERFETGRVVKSFSINDRKDRMETAENRGSGSIAGRRGDARACWAEEPHVWVERIDVDAVRRLDAVAIAVLRGEAWLHRAKCGVRSRPRHAATGK